MGIQNVSDFYVSNAQIPNARCSETMANVVFCESEGSGEGIEIEKRNVNRNLDIQITEHVKSNLKLYLDSG